VRHAQLRGPEHVIYGGIAVIAEGGLGIALSRGGAPKPYAHREPNEDCVGFLWSEWGAVLAQLGLEVELPLPRAKSRYRRDKRHYSQVLDSSSRALVERMCARELAAFGYPWEGAPQ